MNRAVECVAPDSHWYQDMMTQTAEQASAKLLRWDSKEECINFLESHNIAAVQHYNGNHYIAIFFDDRGVFGISSPTTGELLPDW